MSVALVRTSLFLTDYREIALRISSENPDAANRFCDAVETALDLLTRHPQIGRFAHFVAAPKVRRWVLRRYPNYLIYYEDRPGEILLIRLLHGARNPGSLVED
jgi:plasmid stabilization system protein ParE